MDNYLKETKILDYSHEWIQKLVNQRQWRKQEPISRIKSIYNFVRDQIKFGYNRQDNITASAVLKDMYGQCNTKANLLMALLRAVDIPNRIHGFRVDKALQKGVINGIWYMLSPDEILHSWVEVRVEQQWYILEGVILDVPYVGKLQKQNSQIQTYFCGYGISTDNFKNPPISWNLNNTFIQHKAIIEDLGLFDSPDEFYQKHSQELNAIQGFVFKYMLRHIMNKNVQRIRKST